MRYKKSQASIMEYVLLTLFIVFIIMALIFFITWWQFSQFRTEKSSIADKRALSLLKYFSDTPSLVKENSMFDDSKLTAAKVSLKCEDLEGIFGYGWYMKIRVFGGDETECTWSNYPNCNSWVFCPENIREGYGKSVKVVPVNIYRKMEDLVTLGNLTVGVYVD